ncbi:alpha/beta hydrolase [Paenibacillus sp. VCA1]|uniref:alpha/beta fold hydrolase n=1 Tax=Paenibacillus sp. VCA1 TaxID=3039148 RepID=UPI00287212CC|nr:alpha/beta hydrolase [Paenibacillus sp. VCA1]MDR9857019.1 alpha/beta hydrolase [Paenibacillus sp. VCA1]
MTERFIQTRGVDICTESFGDPKDPAVLLIMGASVSMIWWEDDFCRKIADRGRFVIRYDNRDVGRSVTYAPGQPEYSFEDLADDAMGVLDGYGIEKAHIVGMSMGGLLTQILALRHRERVLSVTLIATSNFAPGLPPMEERVERFFAGQGEVDWSDMEAVVSFSLERWRVLRGSGRTFDEQKIARLSEKEAKRAVSPASMSNHAFVTGGETYLMRTGEIDVPTLIIHGTEDPIIPYPHAVHLAEAIPGAKLITLSGAGHELHEEDWDLIIGAIIDHTAR